MARSTPALARPRALIWARESAGLGQTAAAKKVGVKPEKLRGWEAGEAHPTFKQLLQLAATYKRPVALFYLQELPKQPPDIRDFRRNPAESPQAESPELRLEIRRARHRRELALDLADALEEEFVEFSFSASLEEEPEVVARRIRDFLSIGPWTHQSWSSPHEAFNAWRSAIESRDVYVFQATRLPRGEAQGFSLSESVLPIVVVNIKDHPHARIFTLLHEFTHLALRQEGVCEPFEDPPNRAEDRRIEVFCNGVAGASLVPQELLLAELEVQRATRGTPPTRDAIRALATRFRVSREVILRRLLTLNRITGGHYAREREALLEEYRSMSVDRAEGFAPPHRIAVSAAGPSFTRLALDALHQDRISFSELSDFLEVRSKHLQTIEDDFRQGSGQG